MFATVLLSFGLVEEISENSFSLTLIFELFVNYRTVGMRQEDNTNDNSQTYYDLNKWKNWFLLFSWGDRQGEPSHGSLNIPELVHW